MTGKSALAVYSGAKLAKLAALGAATAAFTIGIHWGTFAAGGSDSSCYLNQARLFSQGTTHIEQPLVIAAPWPNAAWTFTPAGHIPSPVRADSIVPMCPPGLSILMAAARLLHGSEFVVVPLCGALMVWLTFALGDALNGTASGAAAALLVTCSPIFLFQVVQPMTDVPAAALWLLVTVLAVGADEGRGRPFAAGLAASIAVLTRPNLLPLAGIVAVYLALDVPAFRPANAALKRRATRFVWFAAGLAPGLALLGVLQARMYGSPFATGYGAAGNLFAVSRVGENLRRYLIWLVETHTPLLAFGVTAPFFVRRRAAAWLCVALAAATVALYLPYQVFDAWWYLRFLLPAIPFLAVLSVIAIDRILGYAVDQITKFVARAAPHRCFAASRWLPSAIVVVLAAVWFTTARSRSAFDVRDLERHFLDAGKFAAEHLPRRAVVLTVRHSGSVQYYAQLPTVSWDTLEPGSLDRTQAFLRARGLVPLLLLAVTEEEEFRRRFEDASAIGRLDWPPLARVGRLVRVYDPDDRARYFAGAVIQTIDWTAVSQK